MFHISLTLFRHLLLFANLFLSSSLQLVLHRVLRRGMVYQNSKVTGFGGRLAYQPSGPCQKFSEWHQLLPCDAAEYE
jgi:hypothetical protein